MPRELIQPRVAEHRGRIVKTAGDGALVEFASAIVAWASNHPAAVLAFLSGCREEVAWFYGAPRGSSGLASLATLFTPKAWPH
jgi:class 3 adenylate cyclase